MANNIPISTGDASKIVASEDISGSQYQQVKLIIADAGSSSPTGVYNKSLFATLANSGTLKVVGIISSVANIDTLSTVTLVANANIGSVNKIGRASCRERV